MSNRAVKQSEVYRQAWGLIEEFCRDRNAIHRAPEEKREEKVRACQETQARLREFLAANLRVPEAAWSWSCGTNGSLTSTVPNNTTA